MWQCLAGIIFGVWDLGEGSMLEIYIWILSACREREYWKLQAESDYHY